MGYGSVRRRTSDRLTLDQRCRLGHSDMETKKQQNNRKTMKLELYIVVDLVDRWRFGTHEGAPLSH